MRRTIGIVLMCFLAATSMMSQPVLFASGHATVRGKVLDHAGNPVSGAEIDFFNMDHWSSRSGRQEAILSQAVGIC